MSCRSRRSATSAWRLGAALLLLGIGASRAALAEIEIISAATSAWLCNDGQETAKVGKKLFRMPVCTVAPRSPRLPPCPPRIEVVSVVLWGDDEPVQRPIEVRIYRFSPEGELLERYESRARQQEGRLVARLRAPRDQQQGERLEATFVLPRRVRLLEAGECLTFIVNPSRWVDPG